MQVYSSLLYAHLLLMVFWIGSDIGVFIAGLHFMDSRRSLDQRRGAIAVGMVIDRYPRVCFVLTLPVGAQLAWLLGLLPISATSMIVLWAVCLAWFGVVVFGMIVAGQPRARLCQRIERVLHVIVGLALMCGGVWLLRNDGDAARWLAGKMMMYGLICVFALLLELAFPPVMAAFTTIADQGSTPAIEARLRNSMKWSYLWVLGIYSCVLIAGFLGTVKP
jgi:hypothetical protein